MGVAHGKMTEEQLSEVWSQLLENEIDVLVCTTIIETGVDVPNANTLIIENADRMGLSQLHQLRGRVGRSSRRAFAYLTFVRGKVLTDIATKRLNAIREFTEFGAGFKIAMRDLEIRGAGNILGAEQHGHMEAVGYDMYLKLLNEAVREEKGEAPEKREDECLVDLQVEAHIPERYIQSSQQRLYVYRRIADIRSQEDASDVFASKLFEDRKSVEQFRSFIHAKAGFAGRLRRRRPAQGPGDAQRRAEALFAGEDGKGPVASGLFGGRVRPEADVTSRAARKYVNHIHMTSEPPRQKEECECISHSSFVFPQYAERALV